MIALAFLVPLLILGAVVAGIVALSRRNDSEPEDGIARRLVVSVLTFGMTVVTAVGLYQLIDLVLTSGGGIARSGSSDVAQALSFLIVGVPSSALLWRYLYRALAGEDGRSIVWLLHATIASATFSIGTVVALGNGIRFDRFESAERSSLAFGVAWLVAWLFHEWIRTRRPVAVVPGMPRAVGAAVGLVTAAGAGVAVIGELLQEAFDPGVFAGSGGWDAVGRAAAWMVIGIVVWLWQFARRDLATDAAAATVAVGLGIGGGAILGLGGLAGILFTVFGSIDGPLDTETFNRFVGAVAVGFLVWRYHDRLVREPGRRSIARHLVSGLTLVGLASSVGVLVNAGLASLAPALAATNERDLLWGGLSTLLVAAPAWWIAWRPDQRPHPDAGTPVQRTYLTLLAGVAGVTEAVALIVLVFRLIEGLLESVGLSGTIDRVRAPLGFVVATGLVAVYHYRRWQESRGDEEKPEPIRLQRVTLVGSADLAEPLRDRLGVRVTEWRSAGEGRVLAPEELVEHLRSLDATDALVVEEERGYRVLRLSKDGHLPQTDEPQE